MQDINTFDNIKVSTKTFTISTNVIVDCDRLFEQLEIYPYTIQPKRRGRKKKNSIPIEETKIPYGSILTVKYEDKLKGVDFKPNKNNNSWFRNSVSIVLNLDKRINFKVCKNGTLQMTGIKQDYQVVDCIKYFWNIIKNKENIFTFKNDYTFFSCMIIPSMRNIDFDLGFKVDRSKLSEYLSSNPTLRCLMETSFGYTGVNIKIPMTMDKNNIDIKVLTYKDEIWTIRDDKYSTFLNTLDIKDRNKKINDTKYNTFLVFHSGKVIFSGMTYTTMENTYYDFIKTIEECKNEIMEILVV